MWFFILAELSVFALLILAFAVAQVLKPEVFATGGAQLDTSTGLAMTLSLLTAGWLAAWGIKCAWGSRAVLLCGALLVALVWRSNSANAHLAGRTVGTAPSSPCTGF
jgi:nitric oxide reductase NorE protein